MDKTGVGGLIANIIIGSASDYYENHLSDETKEISRNSNIKDEANGISVIARII